MDFKDGKKNKLNGRNGGRKCEHEFLFSWRNGKPRLESGRLHLRYGNGIAKAIVSHARAVVRVSPFEKECPLE